MIVHSVGSFRGAGGLHLHYQHWRSDTTPPAAILALVHGFGEHSGRYGNVVEHLTERGYAVYGFDNRGHGRSPGQRGHINAWAEFREDVGAFLSLIGEREPGLPLFLMGHSLGGLIVLDYALHHPEGLAGVIASGPVLGPPDISPALLMLSRLLSRLWPRFSLSAGLDAGSLSRDPSVVQAYRDDPLTHDRASARLGTEMAAAVRWTQAHAADLRLPLLIVHGGADRLVPPEYSRLFFENVTFADKERHEYEGVYHEPHNDIEARRVLDDISAWLDRHRVRDGPAPTISDGPAPPHAATSPRQA